MAFLKSLPNSWAGLWVAILVLLGSGFVPAAEAEDLTVDLLQARFVEDRLYFQVDGEVLLFKVDHRNDNSKTLASTADGAPTFAVADDQLELVVMDFNPLLHKLAFGGKLEPDPNFNALAALVEAASGTAAALESVAVTTREGSPAAAAADAAAAGECAGDAVLRLELVRLRTNLEVSLTAADLKGWVRRATGHKGIEGVVAEITTKLTELQGAIQAIEEGRKAVQDLSKNSLMVIEKAGVVTDVRCLRQCTDWCPATLALAVDIASRVADGLQQQRQLVRELKDLQHRLQAFAGGIWINQGQDYVFGRRDNPRGQIDTVTVTVVPLTLSESPLRIAEGTPRTGIVRLRQYSRFVTEGAAGAIYPIDLEIPVYGTEENDEGQTVVALARTDSPDFEGAAMVNVLWRWRKHSSSPVFPGIQVGLSQGEETPGVLLGAVLRFTQPLAISVGGVYTRYKDLDELSVGDPVEGTADIEADLKSVDEVAWYVGLQYTF
ncbi:MAG TPA: hypothetical protein VHQ65_13080 [Thermoanaerobaculia bacterium]|nr:hypothetical protein [Thermoanaerobaculia bacterium]